MTLWSAQKMVPFLVSNITPRPPPPEERKRYLRALTSFLAYDLYTYRKKKIINKIKQKQQGENVSVSEDTDEK